MVRSSVAQVELPAGALITFLQKGLEYVGIEEHINEDGSIREFDGNYSLLSPFICEAIGVKEERRYRSKLQHTEGATPAPVEPSAADGAAEAKPAAPLKTEDSAETAMEVSEPPADTTTSVRSGPAHVVCTHADISLLSSELGFKSIELKCHSGKEVYTSSWNPLKQQVVSGYDLSCCWHDCSAAR